jgi:hypothetical protein
VAEYDSYLLRVWRSRRHEGWAWALRLEHLQDGEVRRFEDPQGLVEALWALAEPARPAGPGPPQTGGQAGAGPSADEEQHCG